MLSTAGCVCLYAVAGNQPNYPSGDSKKGSEGTLEFSPSPQQSTAFCKIRRTSLLVSAARN